MNYIFNYPKSDDYQKQLSQINNAHSQLEKYRVECESYKRTNETLVTETHTYKQKNLRQNEELLKKLYAHFPFIDLYKILFVFLNS